MLVSLANVGYAAPITVLLPKLIHDVYHAGPWLLGAVGTVGALGGLTGTLVNGQLQRLRHRGITAYLAVALSSLAIIGFALPFPDFLRPFTACVASFIANFSLSTFSIIWITVLQELVPAEKLGRVSSIEMLGTYSFLPVGFILMGILSDHIGPSWVFLGGGGILLAISLIGLCLRNIQQLH